MISRKIRLSLVLAVGLMLQSCDRKVESEEGYKALPSVTITPKLKAQIDSFRAIAREKGWTFTPRVTGASGRSLQSLTGELQLTAAEMKAAPILTEQALRISRAYDRLVLAQNPDLRIACNAGLQAWDWRAQGKVTPPKNQECGDCWAFASAGQIESAMLMAGRSQQDLSEQHILDCSNSGDCGGGRRWDALPWAVGTAVATQAQYPYAHGVKQQCQAGITGPSKLLAAGWIDSSGNVAPVATLKAALCEYGPISVSIYASPALQSYGGDENEVFNENNNNNGTNHAILLVGWSDSKQAWLMKNSWGSGWGWGGGYGWIHYGSNNIGRWPVWAKAPAPNIRLNPALNQLIVQYRTLAQRLRPPRPPEPRPNERP